MVILALCATVFFGWASSYFESPYVPWHPIVMNPDQRWQIFVLISIAGACRTVGANQSIAVGAVPCHACHVQCQLLQ
jgi:hypothetical protein